VRVFQGDQACDRIVGVIGTDRRLDVLQQQRSIRLVGELARVHPSQGRNPSSLKQEGMRFVPQDCFVAAGAMRQNGSKIAHCARGDEKPGLFTQHVRRNFLQAVHRWVFAINIVAYISLGHRLAHGRVGWVTVSDRKSMNFIRASQFI
jgi:hypothetical protein